MHKSGKFHAALLSAAMFVGAVSPAAGLMAAENGSWVKSGDLYWYKNADGTWPANTWAKINGKWYHFNDNGFMQSGWKKFDGNWYYLGDKNDGAMKTGWVNEGGKYYFLDSAGKMLTGWRTISGKSYYFWADGSMAKNTTIDGYKVGADGAWIKEETKPVEEQKPSTDTNTDSSLNNEYVSVIKEAIQLAQKNSNTGLVLPLDVYNWISGPADQLLEFDDFQNFLELVTKERSDISGVPNIPSDAFYQYLAAAGYDMDAALKAYGAWAEQTLSALPASERDNAASWGAMYGGFPYSMTKEVLNYLAAKGLVSQTLADSWSWGK